MPPASLVHPDNSQAITLSTIHGQPSLKTEFYSKVSCQDCMFVEGSILPGQS
jgi:hypothetical protein